MLKLTLAATAATLLLGVVPAASATYVDPWTTSMTGGISVVFGNNGFEDPGAESIPGETVSTSVYDPVTGAFTDTFDFFLPDGIVGFTLSSIGFAANSSIANITMEFNGTNIPLNVVANGSGGVTITGASGAFPIVLGGPQSLVISGTAGAEAVYGSTATFELAAAVPEPASWALMIAGFGGAGAMLRRRARSLAAV